VTNPRLSSEIHIQDPNAVFQPRQPYQNDATASGSDNSGYSRSIIQDGQTVRTETNGKQIGSTREVNEAQNQAAGTPFDYAIHPVTKCRLAPSELQEDSIVHFGDCSMTIAQARAANFIPANWQRPGSNPTSAQPTPTEGTPNRPLGEGQEQQQEEVHPDLQFNLLADIALDQDYSALVDNTGGAEQLQAIQQVAETGEIDGRTLSALSSQLGCEPDQLQGRIAPIMEAFKQQALGVLSEGGLDGNAVVAWAQQHKAEAFQQAMKQQGTMRQTSGYAALRTEYLESLAEHSPSVALNADLGSGITQYQNAKGQVIVRIPGMSEMLWRTAIKSFGVRK
jgi:hypothetical protein